ELETLVDDELGETRAEVLLGNAVGLEERLGFASLPEEDSWKKGERRGTCASLLNTS
ncbi:hypothetical protein Tco_0416895, partial [Tanacetum coccineum]